MEDESSDDQYRDFSQYRELTDAETALLQEQKARSKNSAASTRRQAENLGWPVPDGTLLIHNLVDTSTGYVNVYDVRESGRKLMTVRKAAKRLDIDQRRLRGWVNSGNLPGYRMPRDGGGERWFIYTDVVHELVARTSRDNDDQ
jgi:hypothetical protein